MIASFFDGEVDRFELIYTTCVSLINQRAGIRTLLPLEPTGMEDETDEIFKMTTKDGELKIETETVKNEVKDFPSDMIYEQSPDQLIQAIMPLYLNS